MVVFILFFLVILLLVAFVKPMVSETHIHMVDAEWMSPQSKFELISRWGAK